MNNTSMPIRAAPYAHQQEAFDFACRLFGLTEGGDADENEVWNLQQTDMAKAEPAKENEQ